MMELDPIHTRISDYVAQYAEETPEAEAVVFGDERLTYAELNTRVDKWAKAMMAIGIQKGDRVATLSTSRTEYWETFLAAASIGAIWLGLNPKYQEQELRYFLEDGKPKLLLAIASFEGRAYTDVVCRLGAEYEFIDKVISLTGPIAGASSFDDFLVAGEAVSDDALDDRRDVVDRMDPALLVYTSGSTGQPKGALLSHYGLCFGASVQNSHFLVKRPRMICNFPINHVACVADTCCVNLVAGGTLIFQERFDPGRILGTIGEEQVNFIGGVPTMLMLLLDHPNFEETDWSSVELIGWGGAALPIPIIERLRELAPRLMNVYGMTETAANTTYTSPDADIIELSETIGHPSPHMPCRIINEAGKVCDVGAQGELQFKGEYLLLEYLGRSEATRDVYTKDGWLRTGDLGYWRESGAITLVGRMSDMFKSGGYNVYPREIELFLETHDAVEMAAIVSVPDALYQEVGAAYVILSRVASSGSVAMNEDTLRAFCKEGLANYKVPKHFKIVAELPTLPVGKIDKVALKQQALELVNSERSAWV